jgi:hypothetical protein
MTWNNFYLGNQSSCFQGLCVTTPPVCPTFCNECPYVDSSTLYLTPQFPSGHPPLDLQPTELYYNANVNKWIGYGFHYGLGFQGFDWFEWELFCHPAVPGFINTPFPEICQNVPWCYQTPQIGGCTQGQTTLAYGQISCHPFTAQGMGAIISSSPSPMPGLYGCFVNGFLIAHVSLIGLGHNNYPLATLNGNYPLSRIGPAFWQCVLPGGIGVINFGSLVGPVNIGNNGYSQVCYGIGIFAESNCAIFGVASYPPGLCTPGGNINIGFNYNDGSGAGIYDCLPGSSITITSIE